eukprot:CAMPEP_0172895174 /NCGR_PEP_ID=MMETSP1075-20121228/152496_1 /TAXON_ID=2916 /ORGANISM="Ceratium fusus, Strain PA161109" /LENGTH=134 /DNA_ID=CAMNT_0013750345 /DNA_START=45 /DNA_END=450 /DNA_ORIENTATION=+
MAGDSGRWEAALHFLDEMWEWEVVPDEVTYDTVIRACQRCQRWEEALHVFRQMRRKGFRPEEPTYAAVAASCRKSGQDQLAESVEREARILLRDHPDYGRCVKVMTILGRLSLADVANVADRLHQDCHLYRPVE